MGVVIEKAGAHHAFSVVGDEIRLVMGGTQFELFEATGPVGSGPPPHSHAWDEGYLVLEGALVVGCDDGEVTVGVGESALIAGDTTHWYRFAEEGTRMLTLTGGNRAAAFYADMDATVPPGIPNDDTMPVLIAVAKRNGLSSPLF